jgi:regulator of cell morphogenesis and NO signaling
MSNLSLQETVGRLVAAQPSRSKVFERWGLDYCCGGKKPLAEACAERGLEPETVLRELAAEDARPTAGVGTDWTTAPLSALCDHIIATHHDYLREALPRLTLLTDKVANAHGDKRPELRDVATLFATFRRELENHMRKEEVILFPLIKTLETVEMLPAFHCGSVANPIQVMELEHDDAGAALERLRALTNGFTPPPGACNTYRAMLDALAELEADMHQHVHKENNILFPRAAQREAELAPTSGR